MDKSIGICSDKRRILKDIDIDFDIGFEYENERYVITHKGFPFQYVKLGDFTRSILDHIRKMVWINKNGSIIDEIDSHNAKIEGKHDRKLEDMIRQFSKDIRKSLIKDAYGI